MHADPIVTEPCIIYITHAKREWHITHVMTMTTVNRHEYECMHGRPIWCILFVSVRHVCHNIDWSCTPATVIT